MKQQLTEALAQYDNEDLTRDDWDVEPAYAAARLVERLLPGECGSCPPMNHQLPPNERSFCICATCHGSGQVWDEGIVEAVAAAILGRPLTEARSAAVQEMQRQAARAVLSVIAQLAEAGSQ